MPNYKGLFIEFQIVNQVELIYDQNIKTFYQ